MALWEEGLIARGGNGRREEEEGRGGKRDGDSAAIKAVRATLSRQEIDEGRRGVVSNVF